MQDSAEESVRILGAVPREWVGAQRPGRHVYQDRMSAPARAMERRCMIFFSMMESLRSVAPQVGGRVRLVVPEQVVRAFGKGRAQRFS